MKNYQDTIKQVINANEWVCFGDIIKRLKVNSQSKQEQLYRAWQDLKINGTLQIGVSGLYRVNQ